MPKRIDYLDDPTAPRANSLVPSANVIVINDAHLRRLLAAYCRYYHQSRTHLGLEKDAPDGRPTQRAGPATVTPESGGRAHGNGQDRGRGHLR